MAEKTEEDFYTDNEGVRYMLTRTFLDFSSSLVRLSVILIEHESKLYADCKET